MAAPEFAARQPLEDARWAVARLEGVRTATEARVLWVAAISLLRAVGHVLRKVDAASDARVQSAVDALWAEWQADRHQHRVFWDFVDPERNDVLKEYKFGFRHGPLMDGREGEPDLLVHPYYLPLERESYFTEDARDIATDALAWWERQLAELESRVGSGHSAPAI